MKIKLPQSSEMADPRSVENVVIFWKQNDSALYGRRVDMIARYFKRRDRRLGVYVVDAPISRQALAGLPGNGYEDFFSMMRRLAYQKHLRVCSQEGVEHIGFVYSHDVDADTTDPFDFPGRDRFVDTLTDFFSARRVKPESSLVLLYPVLDHLDEILTVFGDSYLVCDIVDDQRTWPHHDAAAIEKLSAQYQATISASSLVLANCDRVRDSFAPFGKPVHVIPNACDEWRPVACDDARYRRLCELPSPIVLYSGNLEHKIDTDLIGFLARKRPEWRIVLVGSKHTETITDALAEHPNVWTPGIVPYPDIMAWIARADVCIIPHRRTSQTDAMNPLKLYAYMAAKKPVVSTEIANLTGFEDLIAIAEDPNDFVVQCERYIRHQVSIDEDTLVRRLRTEGWDARIRDLVSLVERGPTPRQERG